jgi:hypothetical protein
MNCPDCSRPIPRGVLECPGCQREFSHRDHYPEQYSHPLVGKLVNAGGTERIVVKVVTTRFGKLATFDCTKSAFAIKQCKEID